MSILIELDLGDSTTVRGTIVDENGAAVTGATVTARIIPPSGTEASLGSAVEEGTTGVYAITVTPTESGHNLIRFDSDSPYGAAEEGVIFVRESRFS